MSLGLNIGRMCATTLTLGEKLHHGGVLALSKQLPHDTSAWGQVLRLVSCLKSHSHHN